MKSACCAAAPHGFACRPWTDGAPTIFGLADLPLINVVELFSGLVLLLIGAELMVRAAVRLAERLLAHKVTMAPGHVFNLDPSQTSPWSRSPHQ